MPTGYTASVQSGETTPLPQRLRRRRAKGWRKPEGAVIVDRTSRFGNPFEVGRDGTRAQVVSQFAILMQGYIAPGHRVDLAVQEAAYWRIRHNLDLLRGRDLVCPCALDGKPCHADVLIELANVERPSLDRFWADPPRPQILFCIDSEKDRQP